MARTASVLRGFADQCLPSAVPSFLEACTRLASAAAERGDFGCALELIQKAARVAALRQEVA
jgi:hypothetical protein